MSLCVSNYNQVSCRLASTRGRGGGAGSLCHRERKSNKGRPAPKEKQRSTRNETSTFSDCFDPNFKLFAKKKWVCLGGEEWAIS